MGKVGMLLLGIGLIFLVIYGLSRLFKLFSKKDEPKEVKITGKEGINYVARLRPGATGDRPKDWRYYRYNPGGDFIEIYDIILYMLIWDIFAGEEGEYMVDDSFYYEDSIEITNGIEEVPEPTNDVEETVEDTYVAPEPTVEESTRSYESSYSSSDSSDSYSSSSSDSYDSGGSDD